MLLLTSDPENGHVDGKGYVVKNMRTNVLVLWFASEMCKQAKTGSTMVLMGTH